MLLFISITQPGMRCTDLDLMALININNGIQFTPAMTPHTDRTVQSE